MLRLCVLENFGHDHFSHELLSPSQMKSISIVFSVILILIHQTHSYTPTIPPRFDDVVEHLVGTWSNPKTGTVYGTVEEVMRSCGGAIQGMREVPILSPLDVPGIESMRPYHNRADDGFIFFDCGSYTQGHVHYYKTNKDNEEEYDENGVIATLVFHTIPKRRMLIQTIPSVTSKTVYMNMTKKINQQENVIVEQVTNDANQKEPTCRNISIAWKNHIVCQMPTEGQAWMLNRAKWFKFDHVSIKPVEVSFDVYTSLKDDNNGTIDEIIGWTKQIDYQDVDDMKMDHALAHLLDWNHLQDIILPCSHIIQTGAYCEESKEIKAILRIYDSQNQLKSVVLQQGIAGDSF